MLISETIFYLKFDFLDIYLISRFRPLSQKPNASASAVHVPPSRPDLNSTRVRKDQLFTGLLVRGPTVPNCAAAEHNVELYSVTDIIECCLWSIASTWRRSRIRANVTSR
jgi:hypothetical protein